MRMPTGRVPAFNYVVLKPLKLGDRMVQPGETTVLPNEWLPGVLRAHLDSGFLARGDLLDEEFEQPSVTHAPEGYDDLQPTPLPRVAGRYPSDVWSDDPVDDRRFRTDEPMVWLGCWNCRARCYIPEDLDPATRYQCFHCGQIQSREVAESRWMPDLTDHLPSYFMGATDAR